MVPRFMPFSRCLKRALSVWFDSDVNMSVEIQMSLFIISDLTYHMS